MKNTIFVPAISDVSHCEGKQRHGENVGETTPFGSSPAYFGTQRQTVMLVDWDGNVLYRERALWDDWGNSVDRSKGDLTFKFTLQGWKNASLKQMNSDQYLHQTG